MRVPRGVRRARSSLGGGGRPGRGGSVGAFDATWRCSRVIGEGHLVPRGFSMTRALLPAVLLLFPALALGQAAPEAKVDPAPAASAAESAPAAAAVAIDPGTAAKPAGPAASAGVVDPRTWGTRESEWKSHRELAGHVFIPSSVIVDPFSQTAFGLRFGLGGGSATGPSVVWTGDPSNPFVPGPDKDYPYYGLGFGVDASVRFLEWLSARLTIGGDAYL